MKTCTKCLIEKENTDFHIESRRSGGLSNRCKDCVSKYRKKYKEKNPERVNGYARDWARKNPEKCRANQKEWKYGISEDEYNRLLAFQNGVCAICRKSCATGFPLCVDHTHGTLPIKIRGLLCRKCNSGLGMFGDSLEVVSAAVEYLKKTC